MRTSRKESEELSYRLISDYFFPLYRITNETWSFDLSLMHCNSIVPWECPFVVNEFHCLCYDMRRQRLRRAGSPKAEFSRLTAIFFAPLFSLSDVRKENRSVQFHDSRTHGLGPSLIQ